MSVTPTSLAAALERGPLVLDGGLSNQLEAQGCDLSDELWSARLLADDPGQLEAAHTAYARAGARVLITGSYQATYEGFAHRGVGREEATALLRRSVELARAGAERAAAGRTAADERGAEPVWVAASVGPYGAMLADGSEYRGRYGLSVAELARFHRPRIEALAAAGPDALALETVPDADEAAAMLSAVEGCGVPVWLSYSIAGETTRAGQPLRDAFALAAGVDQVIAVGVNCCAPGDADRAVEIAADITGKPVVVYPNSGEEWDATARSWRGRATFDPGRVKAWRDAGARLIGGCCRVGAERIAELAAVVRGA
ncbi:homocysteine S-methyltransferase [Streptomyces rapamycinicus]|uniref:Homocysteine methyltransferase n=2 Tax=Streptomyces rapamycinicus TaxID=1226757 RepID=A0A0A0NC05_STRRN|nr:homocysteine S-methyltransferase [Streptomyces rapamycinicus]AGP54504.1 homocysteine methyltransferase [Streptomyces rapamycinicus NRRL 5491]MBB4782011.1 homocysteine S-methyltransferase [Streptomyces rapamycinicus]RLV73347.1 homocysteine methyltransferase [Streptomyces rapamycinicus NRRL 5491]UTO62558.1 homocysteine S-methyltransferase [Streptomyces rapamycinicus]UTP30513.1 homocysteine S-methyltransferase [Streptomyces rapamycinicus NRRL 5491]